MPNSGPTTNTEALSTSTSLDDTDRKLISALTEDGRASYSHLAAQVGLSGEAIRLRVERLIRTSTVQVVASVSPEVVGFSLFGLVGITVDRSAAQVAGALTDLPETDFVVSTAGECDLFAEVVCRDEAHLFQTLERIRAIPGVSRCRTSTYMQVHKYTQGNPHLQAFGEAPAGATPTTLDEIDRAIVGLLRHDGRVSYTDLARETGISYPSARRRVVRLRDAGTLNFRTIVNPLTSDGFLQVCIGVRVAGNVDEVVERLCSHEEVKMLVSTLGWYDLILEVTCDSRRHLARFISETLRILPEVSSTETYPYLKIHELSYTWKGLESSL